MSLTFPYAVFRAPAADLMGGVLKVADQAQAAQSQAAQAQAAQAQAEGQAASAEGAATQPPPPPTPPPTATVAPTAGAPVGVNVPGMGTVVPFTRDQLRALDSRASRLSDQLQSAQGRRDRTARELEDASTPAVRTGLEERLSFLDERILIIEREMAENSGLRASLAANLRTTSSADEDTRDSGGNDGPPGGIIALLVLLPISVAVARSIWRRSSRRTVVASNAHNDARFAELEQAIDTVAVEIERVSEGQRFVTKLLREGQPIPDFSAQRSAGAVGVHGSQESGR